MALYSKSIAEIVASTLKNKGAEPSVPKVTKGELKKQERAALKEEKEAAKLAAKEAKEAAKLAAKEEKAAAKLAAKGEKKTGKKVLPAIPEEVEPSPSLEGDTMIEGEDVEMEVVPEPKTKTMAPVKVKKTRKPRAKKEGGVSKKTKVPRWFSEYNKGMEEARGETDKERVRASAEEKWQKKGLPEKAEGERVKHFSKMYKMMFGQQ